MSSLREDSPPICIHYSLQGWGGGSELRDRLNSSPSLGELCAPAPSHNPIPPLPRNFCSVILHVLHKLTRFLVQRAAVWWPQVYWLSSGNGRHLSTDRLLSLAATYRFSGLFDLSLGADLAGSLVCHLQTLKFFQNTLPCDSTGPPFLLSVTNM